MKVNAYCSKCGKHAHLMLTGTDAEILAKRNWYVCSDCIIREIEEAL